MNIFPNNYNNEREREFQKRERDEWVVRWLTNTPTVRKLCNATSGIFLSISSSIFMLVHKKYEYGVEKGISMYAWVVKVYVSLRRLLQGT